MPKALVHTQNDLGQTYPASNLFWIFSWQISKYLLPLESGNLQLKQTKLPEFSLKGNFLWPFPLFSLCSGYPGPITDSPF